MNIPYGRKLWRIDVVAVLAKKNFGEFKSPGGTPKNVQVARITVAKLICIAFCTKESRHTIVCRAA